MRLHEWDGKSLKETGVLENNRALVSALAFSPDGKYLAVGDVSVSQLPRHPHRALIDISLSLPERLSYTMSQRKRSASCPFCYHYLLLLIAPSIQMVTSRWTMHTARIHSLSWTSDSKHVASGSLDTNVHIWSVEKPLKYISIKNAASNGVNGVLWVGPSRLATAGADGIVRLWDITFHA